MKTILRLCLWLAVLAAVPVTAQVAVISGQVNYNGFPVASAPIRVCSVTSTGTPCTPTTPIYEDYTLTTPMPDPTQADAYGNFTIYVPAIASPNLYIVQITPSAGITWSYVYNGAYLSASGGTIVGNLTVTGDLTVDGATTSGLFNATTSPYYEVNGVQIACANLSDCANLAKINAANTFTGFPQTAPVFNVTTEYEVNGVKIAAADLSNGTTGTGAIVLANTPTLITPNIGVATGTSLDLTGILNTSGVTIGGSGGTVGHCLGSSGTAYDTDIACLTSVTTYYQTVESNGTPETQRDALDFSTNFILGDSASPSKTTVDLSDTGISAGACNNPSSITYDAKGRASSCTSGGGTTPVARTCNANGCYRVEADGTIEAWGLSAALLSTGHTETTTITFPTSFTSTTNLVLTTSFVGDPVGDGNPHGADCLVLASTLTTSGATAIGSLTQDANSGGSGYDHFGTGAYCAWHAWGN